MKSFRQFIAEAYDPEVQGRSQIRKQGEGGRVGADRKKTEPEKRRVKAIGGGKTAPAKEYKRRKDAGEQRPTGRATEREQQPTKQRGSAALSAREAQKKAYLERKKRSAVKDEASGKDKKIDLKKSADKLLSKKKKTADPKYKSQKASGYTAPERQKIIRAGRRLVKDIRQGKEKPISQYDPGIRKG